MDVDSSESILALTSDESTYSFAEYETCARTQDECQLWRLFAYGTYNEYVQAGSPIPLNSAQLRKLRLLSLVSLVCFSFIGAVICQI